MGLDIEAILAEVKSWNEKFQTNETLYPKVGMVEFMTLAAEVERLQAQVEAVKALHEPTSEVGDPPDWEYCQVCYALYPCPTVQALGVDTTETSKEH